MSRAPDAVSRDRLGAGGRLDPPLLVCDLDAGDPVPRTARAVVGVTADPQRDPAGTDLLLTTAATADPRCVSVPDPAGSAARLAAVAAAHPHAVTLLVALLRRSPGLPVAAALDAESLAYSTLLGGPEFARWLAATPVRSAPPVGDEPVLLDVSGAAGRRFRITLNRPARRNAYGAGLRDALVEALDTAGALAAVDPAVRVVLDGAGPCFCAGGDLAEFGRTPDPVTAHLVRTLGGAALPLHRLADRVEVRVHGPCVGAGVELPAFAGRVHADPGTTFRLPEVAMGLVPGAGGTVSLPRRIGSARTLWLALTGDAVDAATALRWGLVDALAPIDPAG